MSKRQSFYAVILSLIFSLLVTNCDVISFNGDIETQIMKDTTFTVYFHSYAKGTSDYDDSQVIVKHYDLNDTISSDDFPTGYDSEVEDWKPGYLIRGWRFDTTRGLPVKEEYISEVPNADNSFNYVKKILVSNLANSDDYETYVIHLYPEWFKARMIKLNDMFGKPYSGNTVDEFKSETGVRCDIPTPSSAIFTSGENHVNFAGWYTNPDCTDGSKLTSDADGYYYQSDETNDINLYAKWQYQYVYLDPEDTSSSASDGNVGIDSNRPVKTVAEAKKYLRNNGNAYAIKLMSTINSDDDVGALTELTTSIYNNAILLRNTGFKGAMITIETTTSISDIQNLIIDGGAEWSSGNPITGTNNGIKAEAPVINGTGRITLTDVTIQNNDNISEDTSSSASCIRLEGTLTCSGCNFLSSSSHIFSDSDLRYSSAVICVNSSTSLSNTTISNNKGNGLYTEWGLILNSCTISNNSKYGAYVKVGKELCVDGGTSIGGETYLESSVSGGTVNSAKIKISGTLTTSSTIATIRSDNCAASPEVLIDGNAGNYVTSYIDKFTCATDGYVIKQDPADKKGYIKFHSSGFGLSVEIPDDYVEVDPGYFDSLYVFRSYGYIRFKLYDGVYDKIKSWGTDKPIQYRINDYDGVVKIKWSSDGYYYADIVITDTIPNEFDSSQNQYMGPIILGLNNLQIYSEGIDDKTIITKKNYQIIVQ